MVAVLLEFAAVQTTSVDAPLMITAYHQVKYAKHPPTNVLIASHVTTAHQVKYVTVITSATALACLSMMTKIAHQTMGLH